MKRFIRTYVGENEDQTFTEKEIIDEIDGVKQEVEVILKAGEKIHICRHEEGLPCSLE